MTRKLVTLLITSAALAAPLAAQAQSTATVTINGTVPKACVVGAPGAATLNLNTLTGTDGRITTALASTAIAATTQIQNAWCNTPSTLSLNADPMALVPTPGYSTPAGFSRLITYNATLSGWPTALVDRPKQGSAAVTTPANGAYASALTLNIAALAALDAAGTTETPTAVLEAGGYTGSIVVSVAVQ